MQPTIHWYYEHEGVSQGPCPEPEIIALVRSNKVTASTLVWHSGLDEWDTVEKLKPDWLNQSGSAPALPAAPKQTVPKTEGPRPANDAVPATRLQKPKAGLENSKTSAEDKKAGLLGRLFGGKKAK